MTPFNPLDHPISLSYPRSSLGVTWTMHIPFAMCLVDLVQPEMLVELGVAMGESYCAFCQAVQDLGLGTRCYAIDTWQGDLHAGAYGPEVLATLKAHHDPFYGSFSRLIESTFDAARVHFADGSIDLLHIDGLHTYEAVKHDYESWLPKMSERGVMLFHDINVRERGFDVWRLWMELALRFPHFEFVHEHGLGVLAVGQSYPPALDVLLNASETERLRLRQFFYRLGVGLAAARDLHQHQGHVRNLRAQVEAQCAEIAGLTTQLNTLSAHVQSLQGVERRYKALRRWFPVRMVDDWIEYGARTALGKAWDSGKTRVVRCARLLTRR